jgi:hypothetical protein
VPGHVQVLCRRGQLWVPPVNARRPTDAQVVDYCLGLIHDPRVARVVESLIYTEGPELNTDTSTSREKWLQRGIYVAALAGVVTVAILVGLAAKSLSAWGGADPGTAGWIGGFFAALIVFSVDIRTKVRWP